MIRLLAYIGVLIVLYLVGWALMELGLVAYVLVTIGMIICFGILDARGKLNKTRSE